MLKEKYKFISNDGYDECQIRQRIMSGKLTVARFKKLNHIVRSYNYRNYGLYGFSPNGYPYTCGHEYDCCGCVTSRGATLEINKIGRDRYVISITFYENYNY